MVVGFTDCPTVEVDKALRLSDVIGLEPGVGIPVELINLGTLVMGVLKTSVAVTGQLDMDLISLTAVADEAVEAAID